MAIVKFVILAAAILAVAYLIIFRAGDHNYGCDCRECLRQKRR